MNDMQEVERLRARLAEITGFLELIDTALGPGYATGRWAKGDEGLYWFRKHSDPVHLVGLRIGNEQMLTVGHLRAAAELLARWQAEDAE